VSLLAGLLGTVALAERRLQAFEAEIAQPLNPGVRLGRPPKNHYPDNDLAGTRKARQGTDTGYLMARLQRVDPDVANKIGKGKPYRSINHAAQELGIVARRWLQSRLHCNQGRGPCLARRGHSQHQRQGCTPQTDATQ
jgi:hypothetical protein